MYLNYAEVVPLLKATSIHKNAFDGYLYMPLNVFKWDKIGCNFKSLNSP